MASSAGQLQSVPAKAGQAASAVASLPASNPCVELGSFYSFPNSDKPAELERLALGLTHSATFCQPEEGEEADAPRSGTPGNLNHRHCLACRGPEAMPLDRGPRPGHVSVLLAVAVVLSCHDQGVEVSALALTQQEVNTEKAASWVKVQVTLLFVPFGLAWWELLLPASLQADVQQHNKKEKGMKRKHRFKPPATRSDRPGQPRSHELKPGFHITSSL